MVLWLWSDSGWEYFFLNFFDDLGVWYRVEVRLFFYNVIVDDVGISFYIGLREINEDDVKVI